MGFYENFVTICKSKNIPRGTVCTMCGLNDSAHTKWKTSCPKADTIIKIAQCLKVSIDCLLLGQDITDQQIAPDETTLLTNYRKLSVVSKRFAIEQVEYLVSLETSRELFPYPTTTIKHYLFKVSAGVGQLLLSDDSDEITIPDTPKSRKADFALTINGDSMSPDFEDGDIVLVKAQSSVDIGDICIYILEDKGYIKKFGGDRLISLNAEYDDILLSNYNIDDIRCCGLVISKI